MISGIYKITTVAFFLAGALLGTSCTSDPLEEKDAGVVGEEPPEIQITNIRYRYYEGNILAISGTAADVGYSTSSGAMLSNDLKALFHGRTDQEDDHFAHAESEDAPQAGDEVVSEEKGDASGAVAAEVAKDSKAKWAILTHGEVQMVKSASLAGDGSKNAPQAGWNAENESGQLSKPSQKEDETRAQVKSEKREGLGDIVAEATTIQGNLALKWVDALDGVRMRDINGTEAVTERASIDAKGHRIFSETPVVVNGRGVVATAQSGFILPFRGDRVLHFQGPIQSRIFAVDPTEPSPEHSKSSPPSIRSKKAKTSQNTPSKLNGNEKENTEKQREHSRLKGLLKHRGR